jgi:hypothetical protein
MNKNYLYIPITKEVQLIYIVGLLHEYPNMSDSEIVDNVMELTGNKGFNYDINKLILEARNRIKNEKLKI